MPKTVLAKFRVNLVTPYRDASGEATGYRVDMAPVYDSNPESENGRFFQATPWGSITLATLNPEAAAAFYSGAEVMVTFEVPDRAA